jgi:hypothetical protein
MPELTPDVERELAALDDALAGRRVAPELTELGELALALREERAQINDGFAHELDMRAQRGFPERDPRRRASGRRWWQTLLTVPAFGLAAAVLLIAVIVVADPAGDTDGGGGGSSATQESGGSAASSAASSESAGAGSSDSAGAAGSQTARAAKSAPDAVTDLGAPPVPPAATSGSPGTDGRARRSVERSASLTLAARSRDIDAVSARIQAVTRQQRGFVVSSTVNSSDGGTFELRVPTRNLDAAMAALARLGKVRERAQTARDITAQAVSARSRLRDARTERKSLLRQLGDAVTLTETQAIRARLSIVAREIERARAQVRRVYNRAAFSTVAVELVADNSAAPAPADDQWTPGDAARDALRVLEVAAGVALIVLAVALPLALLASLGAAGARWTRRRRREHALDAV